MPARWKRRAVRLASRAWPSRAVGGAEGDRLQPAAGLPPSSRSSGHGPYRPRRPDHPARGSGEAGFGVAGAEGAEAAQGLHQLEGGAGGVQRAVELEIGGARSAGHLRRQALVEEARKSSRMSARHGEAGGHGVAAALDQQPGLAGGDDRRAEIEAADRAARALADAGPSKAITQAGRL